MRENVNINALETIQEQNSYFLFHYKITKQTILVDLKLCIFWLNSENLNFLYSDIMAQFILNLFIICRRRMERYRSLWVKIIYFYYLFSTDSCLCLSCLATIFNNATEVKKRIFATLFFQILN